MESIEHRARLYSGHQVREMDRCAIELLGVPGYSLMQRAAQASFETLGHCWPEARNLLVFCGPGNNGGDGYELACIARKAGMQVRVISVGGAPKSGEAVLALQAWKSCAGEVLEYSAAFADEAISGADVICDAIFGIGITRDVDGVAAQAIALINDRRFGQGVLAIDLPSGLDADTGHVHGIAVRADQTISFIGRKLGLYVGSGPACCGQRHFHDLGVLEVQDRAGPALAGLLMRDELRLGLPPRSRLAHKGDHGHVLLIGGDAGMAGAALLAARAALRSGSGLVSVATHEAHAANLACAQPEAMFHKVEDAASMGQLVSACDVIAIGPGLGQGDWGQALFESALRSDKPLVVDADALNLLSKSNHRLHAKAVITPHPGEAARLLGVSTAQIQRDRPAAASALRDKYDAVVVLKGAGTLIAGDVLALCPYGNPGMAVGGMGDVLTGVIAALMAQGIEAARAACMGVLAHALAGDVAAVAGERGLLPSDLIEHLRGVLNPRR